MASIVFALCAAALYGSADFLGGLAARRSALLPVMIFSQLAGSCMLVAVLPLLPPASASIADLLWGAAAGVALAIGVTQLYQALALGKMSLAAPVTAVLAVAFSGCVGALAGDRLSLSALAGIALALAAIILIGQDGAPKSTSYNDTTRSSHVVPIALSAGVFIGAFFAALKQSSAGGARGRRAVAPITAARPARCGLAYPARWHTRRAGERALRSCCAPRHADDRGDPDLLVSGEHHHSRPVGSRRASPDDPDCRTVVRGNRSRADWRGLNRPALLQI